jgi:molybdate transport system ATP-binding protein
MPDEGEIWIGDVCVAGRGKFVPPEKRTVGLVFQDYALFPHMTVTGNIAFALGRIPIQQQRDRVDEMLALVGLSQFADRYPHQLSGGQQQRVALARALVRIQHGSGVLLLDEPFSAVDTPMRQVLYRELAQLRQSLAVPIVLVTHDLQEARRLADRLVIIDAGQSLQSGTPSQVMRSPRNARVAQLVGIHNHFHAQFHSAGSGQALLHWADLRLRVKDKGKIKSGTAVTWVLAGEAVQWLAPSRAAHSDANLLSGSFTEVLPLGEISLCRINVQGTPDTIQLNLPTAQLSAMGLDTGAHVSLAVPTDAVHIMPLRT